jgi:hypothetical protein
MRLDQVSDSDLLDLHRLSREMLNALHRAKMQDAILTDLLDEFEHHAASLCRRRFAPDQSSSQIAASS